MTRKINLMYIALINYESKSSGVNKKVNSQIKVFQNQGYSVSLFTIYEGNIVLIRNDRIIANYGKVTRSLFFSTMINSNESFDFIYIRHCICDWNYLKLLKTYANSVVYVEIPTFPYKAEFYNKKNGRLQYLLDRIYWTFCKKYVSKIITYSEEKSIYNIPTIPTLNGFDFANTFINNKIRNKNEINLIFVALFSIGHGLDRLIQGLENYYLESPDLIVNLNVLGSGESYDKQRRYVEKNNELKKHISFKGTVSGNNLTQMLSEADIGICSLATFRNSIEFSSELKSREYGGFGLPMIGNPIIDYLGDNSPYYLKIASNDDPINIKEVISFYNKLQSMPDFNKKIRELTLGKCSMEKTMEELIKDMKNHRGKYNE